MVDTGAIESSCIDSTQPGPPGKDEKQTATTNPEPAAADATNTTVISGSEPDQRTDYSMDKSKEAIPPSPPAKNDDGDGVIEAAMADDSTKIEKTAAKSEGPVCVITLLVTSGKKHPYKIDEKYLTKRNVDIPGITESGRKDPFSISVYTLKELILREWRDEWEPKPSSPTLIRLIHFGKLLADKDPLNRKQCPYCIIPLDRFTSNLLSLSLPPGEAVLI